VLNRSICGVRNTVLLVILGWTSWAQAGEGLDRLNAFFNTEGGIRAEFVQTVEGAAFSQPERSSGTLLMQRPGKFRWDYLSPHPQLIVADGQRLWIYDPDLEQVIVKSQNEALGDTPAQLLSGGGLIEERFVVSELNEPRDGLHWVQLLPRQAEAGFEELRLGFDPRFLVEMELVDGFGQVTRLRFSGMEEGITIPADSFEFVPPEGVDVVGNQ